MARPLFLPDLQRLMAPLRRNLIAKGFAVLCAFVLWFFVNAGKRETQVFQFPVELRNAPARTMLMNPDRVDTVSVRLNGPGALLASLESRRPAILVDLSRVEAGEDARVKIREEMIRVPRGVRILDVEPSRIAVRFEEIRTATLPVTVTRIGKPAEGYKVEDIKVTPSNVVVSGPASALEGLKGVETEPVDVGTLSDSTQRTVALVRSDQLLSVTPERVSVQITVEEAMSSRDFKTKVQVRNVERPFQLRPARVNLTVRGPERIVDQLEFEDGSVYIDGAAFGPGTRTVRPEVKLPAKVELMRLEPAELDLHISEKRDGARR